MNYEMGKSIMNKSIDKLVALLYLDNNYDVTRTDVICKYIYSIFVDSENIYMCEDEISKRIEHNFYVTIHHKEITSVLQDLVYELDCSESKDGKVFKLKKDIYDELCKSTCNSNTEVFIKAFYDEECENTQHSYEYVYNTIYRFIYDLFVKKLDAFSHLLKAKIDSQYFTEHTNFNQFDSNQINLINKFLNYDNDNKDEVIFGVACYALEYCLFMSNKNSKELFIQHISEKSFYLDTNILYRIIGINGMRRKNRTQTFLKKCIETGQKLFVSRYTYNEFMQSVKYHIENIMLQGGKRVNPRIYEELFSDGDIEKFYHQWASLNSSRTIENFYAYIESELLSFIEIYSVELDEMDYKRDKVFMNNCDEYKKLLIDNLNKEEHSAEHDACLLSVIEKRREYKLGDVISTKYFFISTDYNLKIWDDKVAEYINVPRVFYPDQWLNLILRFMSRTTDDIKSFISFLNLSVNNKNIDSRIFSRIVTGITQITEDFEAQKYIMDSLLKKNFEMFDVKNDIMEQSKKISKVYFDEFLDEQRQKTKELEERVKLIEGRKKHSEQEAVGKITTLQADLDDYRKRDEMLKVKLDTSYRKKYKLKAIWALIPSAIVAYLVLCVIQIFPQLPNILIFINSFVSIDYIDIYYTLYYGTIVISASVMIGLIKHYLLNIEKQQEYVQKMISKDN